jgi:hypothetical protein
MNSNLDLHTILESFHKWFRTLNAYRNFVFFLLLTSLYGYIVWRINVLSTAPPSTADVASAQQNVQLPKIPESTVQKLQGLQDNSVRVQTLFNEARQNPFQE